MHSNGLRSPSSLTAVRLVFVAIYEYFQRLGVFSVFENAMAGRQGPHFSPIRRLLSMSLSEIHVIVQRLFSMICSRNSNHNDLRGCL